jgi:hypothetical protein
MSLDGKNTGEMVDRVSQVKLEDGLEDAIVDALKNFRQSVHAWSDAAYTRPRTEVRVAAHSGWRLASAWALGCVLVAGSMAGGVYDHQRQVLSRLAREAQQAKARQLAAEQRAQPSDEDLLATVDSDVSRTVPAAMEPLAQLMDEGESQ